MSAAQSVAATFTRPTFNLIVTINSTVAGGAVTSADGRINCGAGGACVASYDGGTLVTLQASAAPGSIFTGWSGGGCAGTGPCTVTMSALRLVTAAFLGVPPPI